MSWPFHTICPPVGFTRPMMALAKVVFPPPLGPVMTTNALSSMVRSMPRRISVCPPPSSTWKRNPFNSSISNQLLFAVKLVFCPPGGPYLPGNDKLYHNSRRRAIFLQDMSGNLHSEYFQENGTSHKSLVISANHFAHILTFHTIFDRFVLDSKRSAPGRGGVRETREWEAVSRHDRRIGV